MDEISMKFVRVIRYEIEPDTWAKSANFGGFATLIRSCLSHYALVHASADRLAEASQGTLQGDDREIGYGGSPYC